MQERWTVVTFDGVSRLINSATVEGLSVAWETPTDTACLKVYFNSGAHWLLNGSDAEIREPLIKVLEIVPEQARAAYDKSVQKT